MNTTDLIIFEIRANRDKIEAINDKLWGLKLKVIALSTIVSVLLSFGVVQYRSIEVKDIIEGLPCENNARPAK